MAKLKIKGWDTGYNKLKMTEILIEKLVLDEEQAKELLEAVSSGRVISLDFEAEDLAREMGDELAGVGAIVEVE